MHGAYRMGIQGACKYGNVMAGRDVMDAHAHCLHHQSGTAALGTLALQCGMHARTHRSCSHRPPLVGAGRQQAPPRPRCWGCLPTRTGPWSRRTSTGRCCGMRSARTCSGAGHKQPGFLDHLLFALCVCMCVQARACVCVCMVCVCMHICVYARLFVCVRLWHYRTAARSRTGVSGGGGRPGRSSTGKARSFDTRGGGGGGGLPSLPLPMASPSRCDPPLSRAAGTRAAGRPATASWSYLSWRPGSGCWTRPGTTGPYSLAPGLGLRGGRAAT